MEYLTKSNGISYEIVWNLLWDISCASMEYLIKSLEYPREYPLEYPMEYPMENILHVKYYMEFLIEYHMEYPSASYGIPLNIK